MTPCLVCNYWRATVNGRCEACHLDLPADSPRRVSAAPHGEGVADGDGPGPDVDASSGRDRTPRREAMIEATSPLWLSIEGGRDGALRVSLAVCLGCGRPKLTSPPCGFDHLAAILEWAARP